MRYLTFDKFRELIGNSPEETDILEEILDANNIYHSHHTIDGPNLDDGNLDSLLELNGEKGNSHCAIYHRIFLKGRSVGMTTVGGSSVRECCWVTLIYGIDIDQLIKLYKRTMKLKAFL